MRQGQDAVPPERTPAVKRRQPDPDSVNTLVLDKAAKSAGKSVKDLIPDNARPNDWEVGHVDESARTLTTKADETFEPQSSKKTRQLIDDARLQAAKTGKLDQRPPMPLEQASRKIIARSIDDLTDEQEAALTLAARLSNQLTPDSPIQLSSQKPIDFTTVNNARRVMEVAGLAFARQDFKPFIKAYRALTKLEASHIPNGIKLPEGDRVSLEREIGKIFKSQSKQETQLAWDFLNRIERIHNKLPDITSSNFAGIKSPGYFDSSPIEKQYLSGSRKP